jgi:hypothetical protein
MGMSDDASRAFIVLQGERGELVRLAEDIVSAPNADEQRHAIGQMRTYLSVLKERDRPAMEAIEHALKKPAPVKSP